MKCSTVLARIGKELDADLARARIEVDLWIGGLHRRGDCGGEQQVTRIALRETSATLYLGETGRGHLGLTGVTGLVFTGFGTTALGRRASTAPRRTNSRNERKFGLRALVGLVEHNRAIVLRAMRVDVTRRRSQGKSRSRAGPSARSPARSLLVVAACCAR